MEAVALSLLVLNINWSEKFELIRMKRIPFDVNYRLPHKNITMRIPFFHSSGYHVVCFFPSLHYYSPLDGKKEQQLFVHYENFAS